MDISGVLLTLVFVVAGIGLIWFGWTEYQNQQSDIQEAVEIEGTVESIEIDEENTENGHNYEPIVSYTYNYEGQQYSSESLYPGPDGSFNSRGGAEEVTSQYSTGQQTTVYVNEEDPSRAFLIDNPRTFRVFAIMIGGVVFILTGLAISPYKRKSKESTEE